MPAPVGRLTPDAADPLLEPMDEEDSRAVNRSGLVYKYSHFTMSLIYPVSITMLVVVWAVHTLSPMVDLSDSPPLLLVYKEKETDSDAMKLSGALLNAVGVVAMFIGVTFALVLLYKYRCYKLIMGWFVLTLFFLLFWMGWMWLDLFCTAYQLPYNGVAAAFVLVNYAVVGVVSIFWRGAHSMTQGYLICVSCMMGWSLSRLPEWTAWLVLAAVALYDIFAVLTPKGPLKMLVEESMRRNEPIPGLVYESNAPKTGGRRFVERSDQLQRPSYGSMDSVDQAAPSPRQVVVDLQPSPAGSPAAAPTVGPPGDADFEEVHEVKSLKLGLGDFVFYSVLVARAAMYFYLTWVVCMVAVLMGLCATLFCLGIFRKALPALPISIGLGITFFFLTRFLLAPYYLELVLAGHWA
eukprot:EG_transcript_7847